MTNIPCHQSWEPILLEQGYLFAAFDGINRFYLRGDLADSLPLFECPVNSLDYLRAGRDRRAAGPGRPAPGAARRTRSARHQADEDRSPVHGRASRPELAELQRTRLGVESGRPRTATTSPGWRTGRLAARTRRLARPSGTPGRPSGRPGNGRALRRPIQAERRRPRRAAPGRASSSGLPRREARETRRGVDPHRRSIGRLAGGEIRAGDARSSDRGPDPAPALPHDRPPGRGDRHPDAGPTPTGPHSKS